MSSKQQILAAIGRHRVEPRPLPSLDEAWITYADVQQQFTEVLTAIGGRVVVAESLADVERDLRTFEPYAEAKQVCSLVEGIPGSVDLNALDDPHQTEPIELAIVRGQFAVAENGAVWVTDEGIKHRAVLFITQYLALIVPRSEIVHNMHQAYERLSFGAPRFGAFISGPSKTADIEQSLVIGAHGPKATTVYLV